MHDTFEFTLKTTGCAGRFYPHKITNHYAKLMHENCENGKVYGFAFDDVAGFVSYIHRRCSDLSRQARLVTSFP